MISQWTCDFNCRGLAWALRAPLEFHAVPLFDDPPGYERLWSVVRRLVLGVYTTLGWAKLCKEYKAGQNQSNPAVVRIKFDILESNVSCTIVRRPALHSKKCYTLEFTKSYLVWVVCECVA